MAALLEDADLLSEFLTEAGEMLEDVDRRLVELERRPDDAGLLNRIFRGFHTIKGGAGFLEAAALVDVCHRTETVFDRLRSGSLAVDTELMDRVLSATSEVRRMLGEMAGGGKPVAADAGLLAALAAVSGGAAAPSPAPPQHEPDWEALMRALLDGAPRRAPALEAGAPGAVATRAAPASRPEPPECTIRVDTQRLDAIMTLSGEIGLARNRLGFLRNAVLGGATDPETLAHLDLAVNRLGTLVADLQATVMKARMQPVGRVAHKYARVARDIARQLGKELDFAILGEETEIDKTILDELNDPLLHLVRNAVDHGIEMPDERVAAGKAARGTIEIRAEHAGDRIVIRIRDDGRGMSPERLRARAVEKGLMGADEAAILDERAALQLVFLPGLSTKREVTDLSGRGVGMDVVRTNIERLKGRVELSSEAGHGTCVTIVLPLTLAILPVLQVRLGAQPLAVPLSAVREVIALDPARECRVAGRPALLVRGEALPIVSLAAALGFEEAGPGDAGVVTHLGGRCIVLRTDGVIGQDEVAIKPIEGVKPRGIAGATLSGDGELVLILEPRELFEEATRWA